MFETIKDVLLESTIELSLLREEYLWRTDKSLIERQYMLILEEALASHYKDLEALYVQSKDISKLKAKMIVGAMVENGKDLRRQERLERKKLEEEINSLLELSEKTKVEQADLRKEILVEELKGHDVSKRKKERECELNEYLESINFRIENVKKELGN